MWPEPRISQRYPAGCEPNRFYCGYQWGLFYGRYPAGGGAFAFPYGDIWGPECRHLRSQRGLRREGNSAALQHDRDRLFRAQVRCRSRQCAGRRRSLSCGGGGSRASQLPYHRMPRHRQKRGVLPPDRQPCHEDCRLSRRGRHWIRRRAEKCLRHRRRNDQRDEERW